ncbi:MAG: MBOAT family protein [Lachnospiraceae bacterium]|nr:MBOAT family protein [Lachnospiraceae bacterium]
MGTASIEFILFLAILLGVYHVVPTGIKGIVLLGASYLFYGSQNSTYLIFLAVATLFTYGSGLLLEKNIEYRSRAKVIMGITIFANLFVLGWFKYINFFTGGKIESLFLPVGISFYLFMSIGYIVDVYRGKIKAEKNIISYALFVSFFPIIMSGPIERAGNLLPQFKKEYLAKIKFNTERIRDGFVRMLWGYFQKLVLADRIAVAVNTVYGSPESYGGAMVFVASLLYTFQIYCDFAGYSNVAIGIGEIFGIKIIENFRAPYLATSIADFWRRWHISLSSWFRDYLYIPLGGNRKGTIKKYVNVMIVFLLSGLWHGAGWNFILWGGLHGLYQVIGVLVEKIRRKVYRLLNVREDAFSLKGVKVSITFLCVNFAWMLFRITDMELFLRVIKRFKDIQIWQLFDGTIYNLGLDRANVHLILIGLGIVVVVDFLNEKGISVSKCIAKERLWVRWPLYLAAIMIVLVCGMWGSGFNANNFIYYQF